MATKIFFKNNAIVLKKIEYTGLAIETPIRFFQSNAPPKTLQFITALTMNVKMGSRKWPQTASAIAPHLTSLRDSRSSADSHNKNVHNFGSPATLDHLRTLVEQHLWPIKQLNATTRQLVPHFHSGAGVMLPGMWAGRIPWGEPAYVLEHKDTPENEGARSSLVNGRGCSRIFHFGHPGGIGSIIAQVVTRRKWIRRRGGGCLGFEELLPLQRSANAFV